MPSCASAVAAMPGATVSTNPKMMCVTRIASSSRIVSTREIVSTRFSPFAAPGASLHLDIARLVREWPHPQLLLANLPQPGKTVRLDRQEKDDQGADDHQLDVFGGCGANRYTQRIGQAPQHDGQAPDQGRPEKRAGQAAKAADDYHEKDAERQVDIEAVGFRCAEPQKHHHGAGNAAVERRYGERS